jgi:hypothetical protein
VIVGEKKNLVCPPQSNRPHHRPRPLPGYQLFIERELGERELLAFTAQSCPQDPVNNLMKRTNYWEPMGACHQEPGDRWKTKRRDRRLALMPRTRP